MDIVRLTTQPDIFEDAMSNKHFKDINIENTLVKNLLKKTGKQIIRKNIAESLGIEEDGEISLLDDVSNETLKNSLYSVSNNPIVIISLLAKNGMTKELEEIANAYSHLTTLVNKYSNVLEKEIEIEQDKAIETFQQITKEY